MVSVVEPMLEAARRAAGWHQVMHGSVEWPEGADVPSEPGSDDSYVDVGVADTEPAHIGDTGLDEYLMCGHAEDVDVPSRSGDWTVLCAVFREAQRATGPEPGVVDWGPHLAAATEVAVQGKLSLQEKSDDVALSSIVSPAQCMDAEIPPEAPDAVESTLEGKRKELRYNALRGDQRESMEEAMIKQLDEHFAHDAVSGVAKAQAVPGDRTTPSRFILTNKLELESGWKPKARWVGAGHLDPDGAWTAASSPTAILVGHMILLVVATTLKWEIFMCDVSAAFLQGVPLRRELYLRYLRVPKNWPPRVLDWLRKKLGPTMRSDFIRARKGIFGLGESPRMWYLRFKSELEALGFKECRILPGLFVHWEKCGQIDGIISIHVDDALLAIAKHLEAIIAELKRRLSFGTWKSVVEGGKFCGRFYKQGPGLDHVDVDINEYCEALQTLSTASIENEDAPLTEGLCR